MSPLSDPGQIWVLKPTEKDLIAGAMYASITLPWTFNRMMYSTSSMGQQGRALKIAKGIVAQDVLRRRLAELDLEAKAQRKSHRAKDLFDIHVLVDGKRLGLDLKTFNYYTDYADLGREPFSPSLLVKHADYDGPSWHQFFPMLIPHTQISQEKEVYCFAIASSVDFRKREPSGASSFPATAFTYGDAMVFLSSSKLCLEREARGKGFRLSCDYQQGSLLNGKGLRLELVGEWDGKLRRRIAQLRPGRTRVSVGPFSCLNCLQVGGDDWLNLDGRIEISVDSNDFDEPVFNSSKRDVNTPPGEAMVLRRGDFCDLVLPDDYTLHFIGWLSKAEFIDKCRQHRAWVWPNDGVNPTENQPWDMITENDRKTLKRTGFVDCVRESSGSLDAGWLKTTGRGTGACCYVYPNIGWGGGLRETNLYVTPSDLHPMDELGSAG